ncbi:MAG: hypothetical protein ACPGDB_04985, partial [Fusobacterium sp.]
MKIIKLKGGYKLVKEIKKKLIEKTEEKIGKIPKKYISDSLTISDLKKQLKSIIEGIRRGKLKGKGKTKKTQLEKRLKNIGFPASVYLKLARYKAEKYGLDKDKLNFSNKKLKKLNYDGVDFGSSLNNDYIIYNFFEVKGKEPKGTAKT